MIAEWYLPTQLFWYKAIFMAELLIGENLFALKLKKAPYFWLRLLLCIAVCIGFAFAIPIPVYNAFYNAGLFIVMFAFSVFSLCFCYKDKITNVIFCCIAGYSVQHIAFTTYDFIVNTTGLIEQNIYDIYVSTTSSVYLPFQQPLTMFLYLIIYLTVYWLLYLIFSRRIGGEQGDLQLKNEIVLIFFALIIVIDNAVSSFVSYYVMEKSDKFYIAVIDLFNLLCCILMMCFQFELPLRQKLEKELVLLNQIRNQEKEQYFSIKQNIELINRRCHDLKHQIHAIGGAGGLSENAVREMESVINIYDCHVKTDNEALDVILTEKSLLCMKEGIKLSCIIEGRKLSFMAETDIYSLFGNAIDNSIDAVRSLSDDKKIIGITVKSVRGFLSVNIHNYYDGDLVFENGLPQTTKEDKEYHGFGMASIMSICQKYGGDLSIKAENSIFNLNILFPEK